MNPILQAYLLGQRERSAAEQAALETQERSEAKKLEQTRYDEKIKREDTEIDARRKHEDAIRTIERMGLSVDLGKEYSKTGVIPEGYAETGNTMEELAPGVNLTRKFIRNESTGHQFDAYDPPSSIALEKYRGEQLNEGKFEEARKNDERDALNKQLFQNQQNEFNSFRDAEKARETLARERELQVLKGNQSLEQIRLRAATRATADIKNLSTADGKKVDFFNRIQAKLNAAKAKLDATGWNYFMGDTLGGAANAFLLDKEAELKGGETDPDWAAISRDLSEAFQIYANEASGATLTPSEQQILKTHLSNPNHRQTVASAKAKIEGLLEEIPFILDNVHVRYDKKPGSKVDELFPVRK